MYLHRYAFGYYDSQLDLQDIVQESFRKILERHTKSQQAGRPFEINGGYLNRILLSVIGELRRSLGKEGRVERAEVQRYLLAAPNLALVEEAMVSEHAIKKLQKVVIEPLLQDPRKRVEPRRVCKKLILSALDQLTYAQGIEKEWRILSRLVRFRSHKKSAHLREWLCHELKDNGCVLSDLYDCIVILERYESDIGLYPFGQGRHLVLSTLRSIHQRLRDCSGS